MRIILAVTLMMFVLLGGCSKWYGDETATCSSPATIDALNKAIQEAVAAQVRPHSANAEGAAFTSTELKRVTRAIAVTLTDVRTSRDSPGSAALSCKASATAKVPSHVVESADGARATTHLSPVSDRAKDFDVDRISGGWKSDIEFTAQPTDDKTRVYAEVAKDQGIISFLVELVETDLRSGQITTAAAEAQQAAAAEKASVDSAKLETDLATRQAAMAQVNEARVENRLARQTIGALWQSVPGGSWGPILDLQRAWIKRKAADCNLEAATASIDPQQKALAFLHCDTRITAERITWLRERMPQNAGSSGE